MILVVHRVLRHRLLRELLGCLALLPTKVAAAAAAPSPAPATTFAFTAFGARLAFHFRRSGLDFLEFFFFNFLNRRELWLLGSKIARSFRRVHLLAAVDHIRLLPCYSGVGRHGDRYAEALLQSAQMRTLMIEHLERHFCTRAYD